MGLFVELDNRCANLSLNLLANALPEPQAQEVQRQTKICDEILSSKTIIMEEEPEILPV